MLYIDQPNGGTNHNHSNEWQVPIQDWVIYFEWIRFSQVEPSRIILITFKKVVLISSYHQLL